jgi:hypothetical protein
LNAAFRILIDDANDVGDSIGLPPLSAFDLYTTMSRITTSKVNDTVNLACNNQGIDYTSIRVGGWTPPAAPLTNVSTPPRARRPPLVLVGSFRFNAPSCGAVADAATRRSFRKLLSDVANITFQAEEAPVALTVRSSQQSSCVLDASYSLDLRREATERNASGARPINGTAICSQLLSMAPTAVSRKVNDALLAAASSTLVDVIQVTCGGGFPNPSLYYTQTSTTTSTTTASKASTEAPRKLAAETTKATTKAPGTTMYFESYKIRNAAGRDSSVLLVVCLLAFHLTHFYS